MSSKVIQVYKLPKKQIKMLVLEVMRKDNCVDTYV